jgi:hypothetical protein
VNYLAPRKRLPSKAPFETAESFLIVTVESVTIPGRIRQNY